MNVLTQTDQYKLINCKLGLLDQNVISGLNVREGQRVLAVEFLGTPSNSLLNDSRLVQHWDCYDPNYNSQLLFNRALVQQSLSKKVSLCVLKPHIVKNHLFSKVLSDILNAGFDVGSLEMQNLNKLEVDELFEVYKGVLNDYSNMREHLISGPCVILVIEKNDNVVEEFRQLCGPHDPEIAK